MTTQRELDMAYLANMVPRQLKEDQIYDLLVAKAIQSVADELFALTKQGLFKPYINENGVVMVMGMRAEPISLSDLIHGVLIDEDVSVFVEGPSVEDMTPEEIEEWIDENTKGFEEEVLH